MLDVQAEGQRIRHRMFRDLPLTKHCIRWVGFKLVETTKDGAPVGTRIHRSADTIALLGTPLLGAAPRLTPRRGATGRFGLAPADHHRWRGRQERVPAYRMCRHLVCG